MLKHTRYVRHGVWILCLAAASASTVLAQEQPHEEFICTSGPTKRVVSIFNRDESNGERKIGGCRVDYTKDGATKTVWSSKTDSAYCVEKALSLVKKLVAGNFTCKPETVEQPDENEPREQAPASGDRPIE